MWNAGPQGTAGCWGSGSDTCLEARITLIAAWRPKGPRQRWTSQADLMACCQPGKRQASIQALQGSGRERVSENRYASLLPGNTVPGLFLGFFAVDNLPDELAVAGEKSHMACCNGGGD